MADSANMSDVVLPAFEDIPNLKVTDLRKHLKTFGLPVNGNKTDLIDRLQEACLSLKGDSLDNSQLLSFDSSQISELDSADDGAGMEDDVVLFDQDQYTSSYISSSLEDDSKVLDSSTENKISSNSMPPKKRSIPKADCADGGVTEKKLCLNRTNVAHSDFNIKIESKPETVISNKNDLEDKTVLSVKNMSAAERLAMRAKRFNVNSNTTVTSNNSKILNNRNSKQSIISSTVAPDIDVLKKRAERFGQSVSTVMKQIEQKEKLLKRKCKFGASLAISATSSLDEQEKKRQRAERFGIS